MLEELGKGPHPLLLLLPQLGDMRVQLEAALAQDTHKALVMQHWRVLSLPLAHSVAKHREGGQGTAGTEQAAVLCLDLSLLAWRLFAVGAACRAQPADVRVVHTWDWLTLRWLFGHCMPSACGARLPSTATTVATTRGKKGAVCEPKQAGQPAAASHNPMCQCFLDSPVWIHDVSFWVPEGDMVEPLNRDVALRLLGDKGKRKHEHGGDVAGSDDGGGTGLGMSDLGSECDIVVVRWLCHIAGASHTVAGRAIKVGF